MSDNITLPRKHIDYAAHALEHFNKDAPDPLVSEIIHHLRAALAAEQPKHDLMKWAKDAGSSPEDLERFATYTIATRDMEIATLREENEALRRDAERYRWLRDNAAGFSGRTLDAAIDAAMQEDKT
jgi:hypothetical protein